ncbi:proline--tRNA ligase [Culicoidibacter larvae]|uniref:Proline--tRNA ligase n=1 Tax=Culicoidibacter larvae TaxID=2579976 RepID=A0A5R8QER1_9FIRM|nr:proline--tRNA ligase [Culicoidibacter larvae]TLG76505.1 proline--tRNA ligase [Culicoidibacter larvae]
MKQSNLFAYTTKEVSSDATALSHQLLLKGAYVKQIASGIYSYLPLGLRVIRNIEAIVREELEAIGATEMLMPALQPKELWDESGRWAAYGDELMRLTDRNDREFALGPTHEEIITYIVRNVLNSYKKLPLTLFQIQTKYRDEMRPRFGLMRGREFIMKDAYSFSSTDEQLDKIYLDMKAAYINIFTRCGLLFRPVEALTGEIGGSESIEFMALSEIGEDTIVYSTESDFAANSEVADLAVGEPSPDGIGTIAHAKGIEVGQIFKLGTKYSESMKAQFLDQNGRNQPLIMGCYGIGISRVMMAAIEQNHDDKGVVWPKEIAPFSVHIVPVDIKNETQKDIAEQMYISLTESGITTLLDDRDERLGVKLSDADLIGSPIRIVVGRDAAEGIVELKLRNASEAMQNTIEDAKKFVFEY